MNMRFITCLYIVVCGIQSSYLLAQNEGKPLNIVLVLADDHGAHLSALGTPGIKTPNIDALARKGMLFINAFAVVPSCSPSRSSIMTGMYPHSNGHWRNTITPKLDDPEREFTIKSSKVDKVGIHEYLKTLPEILKQEGYYTAITQKFHMSPPWKFPFTEKNTVKNDPKRYKKVISKFIKNADDKPFFIQANIAAPHRPFNIHMANFPEFLPKMNQVSVPKYLADMPLMRRDLQQYYGAVQLADACVGEIVEALKASKVYENTIVIYTGDQGEPYHRSKASVYYAGLHVPFVVTGPSIVENKKSEALVSLIDIMPTFLDYLNLKIPKSVQGHSLKKVLSGELENIDNRNYVFGEHNSHGPSQKEHYPSRMVFDGTFYYIRNLMPKKKHLLPADLRERKPWGNLSYDATIMAQNSHPKHYEMLKQLENGRPYEELYNIIKDEGQLVNLIDDPLYRAKLFELRKVLNTWRKKTNDLVNDPIHIKTRQLEN